MSWMECPGAQEEAIEADSVELTIVPRTSDIGGFEVRRALPSRQRRMIGPFVFFDQMGPSRMPPGKGLDVRPHPHIGLATLTYLFSGEILHRDSLGIVQRIRPGEVNWMTAGRGIVHSERSPDDLRPAGPELSGIQLWIGLPKRHEETEPGFVHHDRDELPLAEDHGTRARVIVGHLFGLRSPVRTFSDMLYADASLEAGSAIPFDADFEERGIYLSEGEIEIGGRSHAAGQLLVLRPGDPVTIRANSPSRLLLIGGESMDGPRHLWWNFVSSSKERLEQAKADWKAGRFASVPGETEFIPLPDG